MGTDSIITVALYVVMAILCLVGLIVRHSAAAVFSKKLFTYFVVSIAIAAALGAVFARSESRVGGVFLVVWGWQFHWVV